MYKVGMWLKDKRSGQLTEILEEKWYNRRTLQAFVLKSCIRPNATMELYPCEITANFEYSPVAQLLYGNNINKGG